MHNCNLHKCIISLCPIALLLYCSIALLPYCYCPIALLPYCPCATAHYSYLTQFVTLHGLIIYY